jgi:BirA family biotin operon repressor/biotin-[acetyl-CoA-carboxylase] ligase
VPDVDRRLRDLLEAAGGPWPGAIGYEPETTSTNDVMKARARQAPEWSALLAGRQTAGRGRQGRVWASPPGNVYLSVLLRPNAATASLIPLAAGLAVVEALPHVEARLKWPNDVLVRARKLAGILAEAQSGPEGLESVVVGIGVNVALGPEDVPPELRDTLTSLRMEGAAADPVEVAAAILGRLRVWYDVLASGRSAAVVAAWKERSVPWWGREVTARSGGRELRGIARGVSASGALLVEAPDGTLKEVVAGDVHEVRPSS